MAASRSSFIKFVDWSSAWIRGGFHFGCLHHRCAGEKIAFKLPVNPESKVQMILTISCLMVLGMVTCMSLFGVIMEQGIPDQLFSAYMNAWKMNVIAALPLQLIIVGPLSRSVLKAIQSNE